MINYFSYTLQSYDFSAKLPNIGGNISTFMQSLRHTEIMEITEIFISHTDHVGEAQVKRFPLMRLPVAFEE